MTTMMNEKRMNEFKSIKIDRSKVLGMIIIGAFIAFEIFNFSTTDFALRDVLGDLKFLGIRWSIMLAFAFCAIDFAGIAKMFSPQSNKGMVKETWFLFSAWILAAGMNAILTWWGVSVAFINNGSLGTSVISQDTMLRIVPVFVATMVWLIRVLLIGSLSFSTNALMDEGTKKRIFQSINKRNKKQTNRKENRRNPIPNSTEHPFNRKNTRNNPIQAQPKQTRKIKF